MLLTLDRLAIREVVADLKGSTRSRHRLKFRLVPSDTITRGRASGLSATPTAKADRRRHQWRSGQMSGTEITPKHSKFEWDIQPDGPP
jgi:hypothetical protein